MGSDARKPHAAAVEDSNTSDNPNFGDVLHVRFSRRDMLKGTAAAAGSLLLGLAGMGACSRPAHATAAAAGPAGLGFDAVPKTLADAVSVPPGYTAQVLYALGDPLAAGVSPYRNDGTDADHERRAGDHHDGMEWFGLDGQGAPSRSASTRGLLAMNHEATTDEKRSSFFLHADGGTSSLPRSAAEADKEMAVHGVSVVEVRKESGAWRTVQDSPFNFRLTPASIIELAGPARGHALLVTRHSPDGRQTRGTLNNCGTGRTPWGTFLTGEENWNGYFTRDEKDDDARGRDKSVAALKRYGLAAGKASRHGWESAGSQDRYARWDISRRGASADGSDDYRNEMNGQGYIVEVDAYDRAAPARKRTALGRFAHESAAFGKLEAGKPVVVYMGDDARGEYIYKWVSAAPWDPADGQARDRMAAGAKYLDEGTLYAARFLPDGTGEWQPLNLENPAVRGHAAYAFADQADVVVHARLAADAAGATKMDRPEWCAVNPANGEVYVSLTNNSKRTVDAKGNAKLPPDAANPRVYVDGQGEGAQKGNPNGHIVRFRDEGPRFAWDIYLFGARSDADAERVNLSRLSAEQDFSSPDGLAFSAATGICWIQTDDSAYTDVSNCMMLAALPGEVGDGAGHSLEYAQADGGTLKVDTRVGRPPQADRLKRFLVGPKGCEITGFCETPDGKAIFVNIQHPGETTRQADIADPDKYASHWPANAGYGAGSRPRSATVVITKDDGGAIGV